MNAAFDEQISNTQERQAGIPGLNLAIAALVLGVASIPFSLIFIGGIYGVIGLVLAIVHLKRKYPLRATAVWGLSLSITGLLLSAGFAPYVVREVLEIKKTMAILEREMLKNAMTNFIQEAQEAEALEEKYFFDGWTGIEAPDFIVKDLDGTEIQLSELRGQRVVLDFWATWCPPCRREIPHFIKLANTFDSNDLVIIGISSESNETLRSFAKKKNINYTLAVDGDLPSPYANIISIPTTFFIDRQGVIRNIVTGYHDFDELKALIMTLDPKPDHNLPN